MRILTVSHNLSLLLLRNDSLAIAGHTVVSPRRSEDVPLLLLQQPIDAMVIGHSVLPAERQPLIQAVRRLRSSMPIIFVYTKPDPGAEPMADQCIDVTEGSGPLVAALDKISEARAA